MKELGRIVFVVVVVVDHTLSPRRSSMDRNDRGPNFR